PGADSGDHRRLAIIVDCFRLARRYVPAHNYSHREQRMADPETHEPLIESRADLIDAMARGRKPESDWRIGTEHEKHVFHTNPRRRDADEGPTVIRALLDGIEKETGWHPFYDGDNPIGLRNDEVAGGISLEPGGQFELSGSPMADLHGTAAELAAH